MMSGGDQTIATTVDSLAPIDTGYTDYSSILAEYFPTLASASKPVHLANGQLSQVVLSQEPTLYDEFQPDFITVSSDMPPPVVALMSKELKASIQFIHLSTTAQI
jgi:hypothetical protein